ncbi:ComEA family DNA-binding protein [Tellurirhabdus bombi]|uniref:ComEA family DNA-binding protein n=1 Tax=Tellurirhabdus bombi TaxID=2907205 RepID=UPI001F37808D|nr:helix-hairpin-helix domain-containing protein [Tellurirhabdus bombi]
MFKSFLPTIRDYFGFSHREARGFVALLVLLSCILLIPWFYRWLTPLPPPSTTLDQPTLDSLLAVLEAEKAKPKPYYAKPQASEMAVSEPVKMTLFAFNPNNTDLESWQRLGLPRWLAERVIRYRSKGGQFRKKEDLLRIYDFPPDLYKKLEAYIVLEPGQTQSNNSRAFSQESLPAKREQAYAKSAPYDRPAKPAIQPFDVNSADTTQLIQLKGIGSKLAGRIVKFRDALGGFVSTEQYREIFGLDSLVVAELQTYGRILTPARKLAINTASVAELDKHVYLSKRQAEILVRYRDQHGPFKSADDLRSIRVLDVAIIERLKPYLSFN